MNVDRGALPLSPDPAGERSEGGASPALTSDVREHADVPGGMVVAHDGSTAAQEALVWALALAARTGWAVHVVRAWQLTTSPAPSTATVGCVPPLAEWERRCRPGDPVRLVGSQRRRRRRATPGRPRRARHRYAAPRRADVDASAERAQARLGTPVNPVLRSREQWTAEDADALVADVRSSPHRVLVDIATADDEQRIDDERRHAGDRRASEGTGA